MNTNDRQHIITCPLVSGNAIIIKNTIVLESIIGQKNAIKQLDYYIKHYSDKICFPDLLFTGSQGLGKTMMARMVAKSIGRELVEVNCSTIKNVDCFIKEILIGKVQGENPKTIFFDEAHALPNDVKDLLLTILNTEDNNKYFGYNDWNIEYDSSKINVIFATTDACMIDRALLSRLNEIYFTLYDNDDLFNILRFYLPEIEINCDKSDIAYACRGRARDAVKLSKKILMYCSDHNNILDDNGWKQIKETFGIYPYGLNHKELEFMKILHKNPTLSLSSIASKMGVKADNVEEEIEIRPKELGFILVNCKGRYLTDDGNSYMKNIK